MIVIKNKQALQKMKQAGQRLAQVMQDVATRVAPGVTTAEIDAFAEERMKQLELKPECKGYGTYKHATCISVNDAVVHGVPSDKFTLKEGDCVSVDMVGSYKGYCADMARTFVLGKNDEAERLVSVAEQALEKGLSLVKAGVLLSDVSHAIQTVVESAGYGVVRDFVGHGIGKDLHEDPQVPNFGEPGEGPRLVAGMTLAIEPMITQKSYQVDVLSDGWTVKTRDGGLAAHVEDTVVVLPDGVGVLTRLAPESL